ncbi:MAG: phenylalanine--tRNA ligase subunit beta [Thermoprotei archaeon]|nr:MAG: phenylalanine--tRNA ligase subunit beta [Thermoprotei archaeon]
MPVIEVSIRDLERLVGETLSLEELEDLLPRLKCEYEGVEGEYVYYEATHDRPDLFSAEGLSRALKGLLEIELGMPGVILRQERVKAHVDGPTYRPYAFFATVHGLKLDDEAVKQIMQLQEKLHITYCRDRRKVSIGVYDLSKVKPPIYYTKAKPEEVKFTPLEFAEELTLKEILELHPKGIEYGHLIKSYEEYPLLVDSEGKVLSMPPIVNSEDTKVTEDTKEVFIDVTATDPQAGLKVLNVVATSIAERGETIGLVEIKGTWSGVTPDLTPESLLYDNTITEKVVGIKVSVEKASELLKKMRMDAKPISETKIEVKIPAYRLDILHPIDIAEDIAMAYGYENIKPEPYPPPHPGMPHPIEFFSKIIRETMVGYGFQEVNSYMMTNKKLLYDMMNLPEQPTVEVLNPKHENYSCIRTWLIPQLMEVLSQSKHADYPQKIFEVGDVVLIDETSSTKTREERHLAFAIADREATLTDLLAVLKSLSLQLGFSYKLEPIDHPSFIPGRSAKIVVNKKSLGILGEIRPRVLLNFELNVPIIAVEININVLKEELISP